jgi:hypothetical protein
MPALTRLEPRYSTVIVVQGYPIIVGAKVKLVPGKNCQKCQEDTDFTSSAIVLIF